MTNSKMTTLKKANLTDIYYPVQAELEDFGVALKSELNSDDALIANIHEHILKMSGKFLRPALTFLSAKSGASYNPNAIRLGVAIELIHTATLVHDDIIDDSKLRRNQPSVHTKWGREISIVAGDYLYAKAFLLLAGLRDVWVSEAFAKCAHIMCEGEMKQIEKRNNFLLSEEEYLKIIHKKTAALFQAACMGGAYYSGANILTIEKMGRYGFNLGMAFQIVDDCLDIVGETESFGKTVGLDLNKNDITLPIIYLFSDLSSDAQQDLLNQMKQGSQDLVPHIKKLIIEKGALDRLMQKAKDYAESAVRELEVLKDSSFRESLFGLSQYCLDRIR